MNAKTVTKSSQPLVTRLNHVGKTHQDSCPQNSSSESSSTHSTDLDREDRAEQNNNRNHFAGLHGMADQTTITTEVISNITAPTDPVIRPYITSDLLDAGTMTSNSKETYEMFQLQWSGNFQYECSQPSEEEKININASKKEISHSINQLIANILYLTLLKSGFNPDIIQQINLA